MLQYLIEHGKMDESELQKTYEDMKRKEKLEQHTYRYGKEKTVSGVHTLTLAVNGSC